MQLRRKQRIHPSHVEIIHGQTTDDHESHIYCYPQSASDTRSSDQEIDGQ